MLNKCEAKTQDLFIYGKFNTRKNPPSRERYRPPESQQYKNVDKSATKLVDFTKKYIGKKNIKTSHISAP